MTGIHRANPIHPCHVLPSSCIRTWIRMVQSRKARLVLNFLIRLNPTNHSHRIVSPPRHHGPTRACHRSWHYQSPGRVHLSSSWLIFNRRYPSSVYPISRCMEFFSELTRLSKRSSRLIFAVVDSFFTQSCRNFYERIPRLASSTVLVASTLRYCSRLVEASTLGSHVLSVRSVSDDLNVHSRVNLFRTYLIPPIIDTATQRK